MYRLPLSLSPPPPITSPSLPHIHWYPGAVIDVTVPEGVDVSFVCSGTRGTHLTLLFTVVNTTGAVSVIRTYTTNCTEDADSCTTTVVLHNVTWYNTGTYWCSASPSDVYQLTVTGNKQLWLLLKFSRH